MRSALALLLALLAVTVEGQRVVAVRGGTLLDDSYSINDAVVLIRGDRIEAVGEDLEIPGGAEIVEAAGGYIVPGFIDNHVHVGRSGVSAEWAWNGVTTLIDNGSATRREGVPGCGLVITAPGGYPAIDVLDAPALEVSTVEEVERYLDREKPDCVKIAIERGFLADYDDAGWPVLTPELVREIVVAAHARKLLVRAHVTQPGELAVAIDAGVDVIAHTPIVPIPSELLRKAAEKRVIFVTTAALWNDKGLEKVVGTNLSSYLWGTLGRGRIAIGSDYPTAPSVGLSKELHALREAHPLLFPARLLRALTRDGAAAAGRTDIGTLAPGSRADVVVMGLDPRRTVDAYDTVRAVVQGGVVIRQEPPIAVFEHWLGEWRITSNATGSSGASFQDVGLRVCDWTSDRLAIRCVDEIKVTWSCGYKALPRQSTSITTFSFNPRTGTFEMTIEEQGASRTQPFAYAPETPFVRWTLEGSALQIDYRLRAVTSTAWESRRTSTFDSGRTEELVRWYLRD